MKKHKICKMIALVSNPIHTASKEPVVWYQLGECRDVTDQYQTGRSAYLRLGQLFMRLFAGLL